MRQLIDQARASGASALNLSNQGLRELPDELGSLTGLTALDLTGND